MFITVHDDDDDDLFSRTIRQSHKNLLLCNILFNSDMKYFDKS